jgi:hypothetical protein
MECHWRIAFENSKNGVGFIFCWLNSQYFPGLILSPRSSQFTCTHHTLSPFSSHFPPPLLLPSSSILCVLSNEISARRSRTIRSPHIGRRDDIADIRSTLILAWLQRVGGKEAASFQCLIPAKIKQPDWMPSLTAYIHTYTHTHTHTHTHTLSLSLSPSHTHALSLYLSISLSLSHTHTHTHTHTLKNTQ